MLTSGKQKSHSALRNTALTSTNPETESVSKVRELTWCPTYHTHLGVLSILWHELPSAGVEYDGCFWES